MPDLETLLEDGEMEEIYKILRQSSVDKQHMICDDTYTYYMYRPYCVDNLPIFTIGNNSQRNPAQEGDIVAVMIGGVIEGPIEQGQAAAIAPGQTVYVAWDGTNPYLTTDESDTSIVCCWGIVIDDQRPIYYGQGRANLPDGYDDLYSIKMIKPACASIEGRQ